MRSIILFTLVGTTLASPLLNLLNPNELPTNPGGPILHPPRPSKPDSEHPRGPYRPRETGPRGHGPVAVNPGGPIRLGNQKDAPVSPNEPYRPAQTGPVVNPGGPINTGNQPYPRLNPVQIQPPGQNPVNPGSPPRLYQGPSADVPNYPSRN